MRMPSAWAVVVLLVVCIVLFGASRLPDMAASVGKSLRIFKREMKELAEDDVGVAGAAADSGNPPGGQPEG